MMILATRRNLSKAGCIAMFILKNMISLAAKTHCIMAFLLYEFDNSPQDIALLRNISGVSAACHMPFIGSVGPKFFLKENMEEVAAIKDINDYFRRAEYIKWKAFRDSDDSLYRINYAACSGSPAVWS